MRTEIIRGCVSDQRLEIVIPNRRAIKGSKQKVSAIRNKYGVIKMKPFYFERIYLVK